MTSNGQDPRDDCRGRMAGGVCHHFNGLLSVMIDNLEGVLSDVPTGTESKERLSEALCAARAAGGVSGMLLSYLGQAKEKQGPQDLSEVIRRSLPVVRAAMPPGTNLESDLPSPGPTVNVSVEQIHQVLKNLVANAWEAAGPDRSLISIAVREVSREEIPTTNRFPKAWRPTKERYAVLAVRDRAGGIDPRYVEHVFDPFFSSKEYGRGLGLSVALGAGRAHDGVIAVTSRPGDGTTMELYLPVCDQPRPTSAEHRVSTTPRVGDAAVLLVDDEAVLRAAGSRLLSRLGFQVLTASDGIEALEVWDEHGDRIVCVICDLTMPRMGGWDTLTALRERRRGLPVVLTTGFDETRALARDHPEQPQVFMSKPWSCAGLRAAIETALR